MPMSPALGQLLRVEHHVLQLTRSDTRPPYAHRERLRRPLPKHTLASIIEECFANRVAHGQASPADFESTGRVYFGQDFGAKPVLVGWVSAAKPTDRASLV